MKTRSLTELNLVLHDSNISMNLLLAIQTRKAFELAMDYIDDDEVRNEIAHYSDTLLHSIWEYINEDELESLEDNGII